MRSTIRFIALGCLFGTLIACSSTGAPATTGGVTTSPGASPDTGSPAASGATLTVTGVEYAYEGIPDSVKTGTTVTFENGGQEVHELVAIRRNEGVTTSLEELLAMPEAESAKFVTFLGVAVASPGETAPEPVTLDQPGSYIFICFIPVGTTALPSVDPSASPDQGVLPDGEPHFLRGMVLS